MLVRQNYSTKLTRARVFLAVTVEWLEKHGQNCRAPRALGHSCKLNIIGSFVHG
jgi:hypothetical protein